MQRLVDSSPTEDEYIEYIADASPSAVVRRCCDAEEVTHHLVQIDIAQSVRLLSSFKFCIITQKYPLTGVSSM